MSTYEVICYAIGQTVIVYAVVYGLVFGVDRLVTTWLRRRKARLARTERSA